MSKTCLALVRHGQSLWNQKNLFTGWTDIDLSRKGREEARLAGRFLKEQGLVFDFAYSSVLKRAIRTLWIILDEMDLMWIPVTKTWRLNERHYGALQGRDKNQMREKYGEEQVQKWRRDWTLKPPAIRKRTLNPKIYKDLTPPTGESLKDTQERLLPFWKQTVDPVIRNKKSVLISAHGNSLRALIKHIENISDDETASLNVSTGQPLIYFVSPETGALKKQLTTTQFGRSSRS